MSGPLVSGPRSADSGGTFRPNPAFADPVQAAFNAAAVTGGEVEIPPGTWSRSTDLVWAQNVTLRGHGSASVIALSGTATVRFGSQALDVTNWVTLEASGVKITGGSSTPALLTVRGATRWATEDLILTGATNGAGILLNGASFIGKIGGGRITNCAIGISAKKQAGDGSDGRGQAGNALEICDQMEIQGCGYAAQIGDPATTETLPVVAMKLHFHDITVEGNTLGGIWNVSGYSVTTDNVYYEQNVGFDERIGSTSGNTIIPVSHVAEDNFHNLSGAPLAYDVVRADHPSIVRPLVIGRSYTALTGTALTDTITKNGHDLLAGTTVSFSSLTGGAGLSTNTTYYVVNRAANTFQVAATAGGSAIDFTTDITDATLVSGLAWQAASTSTDLLIDNPRSVNLVSTTPYVDAGVGTVHAIRGARIGPVVVNEPRGEVIPTASRAYAMGFTAPRDMGVVAVGFTVTTAAGSNDACDVGLYDSALGPLKTAGATTGKLNALGNQKVNLTAPQVLRGGRMYYAAMSFGTFGGTAGRVGGTDRGFGALWTVKGTSAPDRDAGHMAAHPLPTGSSFAPVTPTTTLMPSLVLFES